MVSNVRSELVRHWPVMVSGWSWHGTSILLKLHRHQSTFHLYRLTAELVVFGKYQPEVSVHHKTVSHCYNCFQLFLIDFWLLKPSDLADVSSFDCKFVKFSLCLPVWLNCKISGQWSFLHSYESIINFASIIGWYLKPWLSWKILV